MLILCFLIVGSISIAEEQFINPTDAEKYVGKEKTVCGTVVSATYASGTQGQPTFLYLDRPYPNQIFTVVIWGVDRKTFNSPPEVFYKGKSICVTGKIKSDKVGPEIMVNDPSQIKFKSNPTTSK